MLRNILSVLCFSVLFTSFLEAKVYKPKNVDAITFWVRAPGSHVDQAVTKRPQLKELKKSDMKLTEKELVDHQYSNKKYFYKVISLANLVSSFGKLSSNTDAVLLHFQNGMLVPVMLNDSSLLEDTFVAWEVKVDGTWTSQFPDVPKLDEELRDPRPIKFHANKIVRVDGYYPRLGEDSKKSFSPWNYTDTLFGVEFVNWGAYEKQFSYAGVDLGKNVFQKRCSYCHGVRQVGASFGWDVVDPLPLYKQKNAAQLVNHVKYPKWDALPRGLMMPAQKGATNEEMEALWKWMRAAAESKASPYKP